MTETYLEARQIISQAITALEKAEDTASGSQQVVLLDIIEILRMERIKIDTAGLAKSNDTYAALTEEIKQAKEKLDALTEEIKQLIKKAEQAAQVAGALAKLVEFAAKIVV